MGLVGRNGHIPLYIMIFLIICYLLLPLISVFISKDPAFLLEKLHSDLSFKALSLSLQTTVVAMIVIVVFATPLAYLLAKSNFRGKKVLEVALQMPVVAPSAVVGVGLLLVFGQKGLLGSTFSLFGFSIPFTRIAVVMAQVFMAAPFFITTARQAFEAVDNQLLDVSRTLGVAPWRTFWRVTVPLALPGLLTGIALGWARALGEFGATMMFAGNLPGKTQTLPLAIYTAMESDADVAVAISALLLTVSFLLLLLVSFIDRRMRQTVSAR
ncbi:ABC transporter permease [Effusibacillus dendaii]|uniref:Molybdenum transport system permease n=1 Tax=Effusibacillus dendaii TaxID=2743772 RepID=A0A7I8DHQ1_9BACL|nr:ABC transporter permease [Effusibacillus dendaii]BCJ88150.1 molybdenum ABC transporter permease [Effusibacillus dendaii]